MPATHKGGRRTSLSQRLNLPDDKVCNLCGIPDIDPPIPIEVSDKVCRLLPDDHIRYLRDIADVDDAIAGDITSRGRDGDVAGPGC